MRIASWNVESIRAHHDQVIDWLDANDVDVACFQETRCPSQKFPTSAFTRRGYELVVHGGDGGRGGVAVASRLPIDDPVCGIPGSVPPLDEPRSISLTAGGVRIHTCYAPNGRKVGTHHHEIKLAWFALFTAWLSIDKERHPERLVVGDLNIAPLDIDVWDAARYRRRNLTSPRERQAYEALVDAGDFVDLIRTTFGDEPVFTWWNRRSDFYDTDRGWRLDHALGDARSAERIVAVSIDRAERGREGAADHAPILLTLE